MYSRSQGAQRVVGKVVDHGSSAIEDDERLLPLLGKFFVGHLAEFNGSLRHILPG